MAHSRQKHLVMLMRNPAEFCLLTSRKGPAGLPTGEGRDGKVPFKRAWLWRNQNQTHQRDPRVLTLSHAQSTRHNVLHSRKQNHTETSIFYHKRAPEFQYTHASTTWTTTTSVSYLVWGKRTNVLCIFFFLCLTQILQESC